MGVCVGGGGGGGGWVNVNFMKQDIIFTTFKTLFPLPTSPTSRSRHSYLFPISIRAYNTRYVCYTLYYDIVIILYIVLLYTFTDNKVRYQARIMLCQYLFSPISIESR